MAFDFSSPGAAASAALRQFLLQQEQKRRQDFIDSLTASQAEADNADRAANRQRQVRIDRDQAERDEARQFRNDQAAAQRAFHPTRLTPGTRGHIDC